MKAALSVDSSERPRHSGGILPTNAAPDGLWLSLSAIVGGAMGGILFPTWHHAIESAQVLAELVHYPPDNPIYIYHVQSWTLLHQLAAAILKLGVSELTLAYLFSACVGSLSYLALSNMALALGMRGLSLVLLPLVVHLGRLNDHGPTYPVWIMGHNSSYGIVGLALATLCLGFLGRERALPGGLVLGLLPSVHVSIGCFCYLVVTTGIVNARVRNLLKGKPFILGLSTGLAVTGISIGFHLISPFPVSFPPLAAQEAVPIVRAFIDHWSTHSVAVSPFAFGSIISVAGCLEIARIRHIRDSPVGVFILLAAAYGTAFALISWIPERSLPLPLLQLLPGRFINFMILVSPVIFACGLVRHSSVAFASYALTVLTCWALLPTLDFSIAAIDILIVACWLPALWALPPPQLPRLHPVAPRLATVALAIVLARSFLLYEGALREDFSFRFPSQNFRLNLHNFSGDSFWRSVSKVSGLLLIDNIDLAQLVTRRPVLISPSINQIVYIPKSAYAINEAMKAVYGVDILNPPDSPYVRKGSLDEGLYKSRWCARSRQEWIEEAHRFHFTGVLVGNGCNLSLDKVAENGVFSYYSIPYEQK